MDRPIREIVGERIVLLRRRAKLSQPELAQQAGMSVTTLNRVENAHQSLYMEKIVALATALGTTADYLLGLSDHPSPPPALGRTSQEEHPGESMPHEAKATLPPQPKRQRVRKAPAVV
jgi:transcriptional regulator with XRE-family HTH domain